MNTPVEVPVVALPIHAAWLEHAALVESLRAEHDREINTAEQSIEAERALGLIASALNAIEAKRAEIKEPYLTASKAIDGEAKRLRDPLEIAKVAIAKRVMDWRQREGKRIAEEQRRIREENERRIREQREAEERERQRIAAELAPETPEDQAVAEQLVREAVPTQAPVLVAAPAAPQTTTRTDMGSVQTRKVWDFEVVDADKVPRAYLVVDLTYVRKCVLAGERNIPGVRIFERESLAVGGRR